jgi:hypothetical protein
MFRHKLASSHLSDIGRRPSQFPVPPAAMLTLQHRRRCKLQSLPASARLRVAKVRAYWNGAILICRGMMRLKKGGLPEGVWHGPGEGRLTTALLLLKGHPILPFGLYSS